MKISIITTSFNSIKTVKETLISLQTQKYRNIEKIWIDNYSTDGTYQLLKKFCDNQTILIQKKLSIPDAWNYGIKLSTGEIFTTLNSDDTYYNSLTIKKIIKLFKDFPKCNVVYGDLIYINKKKVIRNWVSDKKINSNKYLDYFFFKNKLKYGWMPPHPSFFIRKKLIKDNKISFKNKYSISFDYDFIIKILNNKKILAIYINEIIVRMSLGGNSNKISNILKKMREDYKIINDNKIGNVLTLILKNISKIKQFFK
jgi:glycosyltransferase